MIVIEVRMIVVMMIVVVTLLTVDNSICGGSGVVDGNRGEGGGWW